MSKMAGIKKLIASLVGGVLMVANNKYGLGIDLDESAQDITNVIIMIITSISVFQLRNEST